MLFGWGGKGWVLPVHEIRKLGCQAGGRWFRLSNDVGHLDRPIGDRDDPAEPPGQVNLLRMCKRVVLCGSLAVVMSLIAFTGPAGADTAARVDPDDAAGVLDMSEVAHAHRVAHGRNKLVHTVTTYEAWDLRDVNGNDSIQIEFQLPGRNRTNPPERLLVISVKDGDLKAKLYSTLGDPPKFLANLSLTRPTDRSVRVTFGKHLLRKGLSSYRYRVFSYYEKSGTDCRRAEPCTDDAPDSQPSGSRGWIRHDL